MKKTYSNFMQLTKKVNAFSAAGVDIGGKINDRK